MFPVAVTTFNIPLLVIFPHVIAPVPVVKLVPVIVVPVIVPVNLPLPTTSRAHDGTPV